MYTYSMSIHLLFSTIITHVHMCTCTKRGSNVVIVEVSSRALWQSVRQYMYTFYIEITIITLCVNGCVKPGVHPPLDHSCNKCSNLIGQQQVSKSHI